MKNNEATVHIKQCYLEVFKDYPDVVDVKTMCEMLGGIHKSLAYRLIRSNKVKHPTFGSTYRMPKLWIIKYIQEQEKTNEISTRIIEERSKFETFNY